MSKIIWKKTDSGLVSDDGRFVVERTYRRTYPWSLRDTKLNWSMTYSTQREAKDNAYAQRTIGYNH